MNNILDGLNPKQLEAVKAVQGTIQINAVAGSGKTRVLTRRIAYMLQQGILPSQILCTTFTKKATEEMNKRLEPLIGKKNLADLMIGTSHAIGYKILAKEYKAMNHPLAGALRYGNPLLVGTSQKIFAEQIKKAMLKSYSLPGEVKEQVEDIAIPQFLKVVGSSKNEYMNPQQYANLVVNEGPRSQAYAEFYFQYEQLKNRECKMDMDDLLYNLVHLFENHPHILAKYQRQFKYILVDEAQDNNELQYRLIKMLGYPEYNVFVVGDDDQSMYTFRGAKPEHFIHFQENYKNVKIIPLQDNYRSNPGILDAANRLIRNNTERLVKQLVGHKQNTDKSVNYAHYDTEDDEAKGIVDEIKILTEKEQYKPKDIAILYRTNAQSQAFEDKLIMAGIPYVIYGGISFYERKEVKDIVAYLELALDPTNNDAFKRIINTPNRFLGKAYMDKVMTIAGKDSQYAVCTSAAQKEYERNGSLDFTNKIKTLQNMFQNNQSPIELVDYILADEGVGYQKFLVGDGDEEEEGNSRLENINTLKYVLQRFTKIEDFLAYMRLMNSKKKHDINGIQLMTIHKSKGLEFKAVFVAGVSNGCLPHFRALEAYNEGKLLAIEEERRLMYVAVTRAEALCSISSISTFNSKPCSISPFVYEMELEQQLVH